jgi:foldase protein PrsA
MTISGTVNDTPATLATNMTKRFPLVALCAILLPAAIVAGCGGVPGNAVAEVDGTPITRQDFDHWMKIAAKSSGAAVPKPPDFAQCVATARKSQANPAKGKPKVTDSQLKAQCRQQYEQLRDQVVNLLVSFEWIEGEAKAQGVTATDAEVKKAFDAQRKQSFPKDADYQKFLANSGQTEADILKRVRLDTLSNKIRDKVVKGKDKVSDAQIAAYYNRNKSTFGQPETRDLQVVLTKTKAKANQAKAELRGGASWPAVAKKYSIDDASKSQGGKLPGVVKGQQEKAFDDAIFSTKKGALTGPVKTQFGWYVFDVTKVTPASQQTLAQATPQIKQTLGTQNQQKALNSFVTDFRKRWKDKTDCRDGFETPDCKNGPKATPTPTAAPQ